MANLRKWSSSASGNATVTGGTNTINFAEGQTPGSVNNSAREVMAQIRTVYKPEEWGWVEHSATVSVASQTAFKLAGDQTSNWTAGRRWRLKSGSTTRYGSVVSSSYTAETTITVTVDSGSLSASHSLAALAAIDANHIPTNTYVTSASLATALGSYITSASVATALSPYVTSNSVSAAIANFVTSDSASAMIATQIAAAPAGGMVLLGYQTLTSGTSFGFSGSWSDYPVLHLLSGYKPVNGSFGSASFAIFTDGGTTPLLTFAMASASAIAANAMDIKVFGGNNQANKVIISLVSAAQSVQSTLTAGSGFVNCVRFYQSASFTAGFAALYGLKSA